MKLIVFTLISFFTASAFANCEANIIVGSHSAQIEAEASMGALEDATDRCYPGDATPLNIECEETSIKYSPGILITRCKQQVSCSVCNDDLQRKYEAID